MFPLERRRASPFLHQSHQSDGLRASHSHRHQLPPSLCPRCLHSGRPVSVQTEIYLLQVPPPGLHVGLLLHRCCRREGRGSGGSCFGTSSCCPPTCPGCPGHQGKPGQPMSPTEGERYNQWNQPEKTRGWSMSDKGTDSISVFISGVKLSLYLCPLHWSCVFVTCWANLHPSLPLSVPLVEELLHYPVRPLAVYIQRLSRVAQVSTVNHVTQDLKDQKSTIRASCISLVHYVQDTVCVLPESCLCSCPASGLQSWSPSWFPPLSSD